MIALGSLIGALVGVIGYYLSFHLGTASGGTIVLVATAAFATAFVASPTHGLLGRRLRRHPQHASASPAVDPPSGHQHGSEGA
jgi:manganese transport system permease protein